MHVIGEDVSERLDVIPAQFRVIVTRRPKYGCRSCEGGILQAPAPASVTDHFNVLKRTYVHRFLAGAIEGQRMKNICGCTLCVTPGHWLLGVGPMPEEKPFFDPATEVSDCKNVGRLEKCPVAAEPRHRTSCDVGIVRVRSP